MRSNLEQKGPPKREDHIYPFYSSVIRLLEGPARKEDLDLVHSWTGWKTDIGAAFCPPPGYNKDDTWAKLKVVNELNKLLKSHLES